MEIDHLGNVRFFTNDRLVLGSESCERITSPKNTRNEVREVFEVPEHTIGSKNLFIFVDGKLLLLERDYEDITSTQIRLTKGLEVSKDFDAVLIKGQEGSEYESGIWDTF